MKSADDRITNLIPNELINIYGRVNLILERYIYEAFFRIDYKLNRGPQISSTFLQYTKCHE